MLLIKVELISRFRNDRTVFSVTLHKIEADGLLLLANTVREQFFSRDSEQGRAQSESESIKV
jgi:hypothetical protein